MAVLSVDLATRRWTDLGIVILDRVQPTTAPTSRYPLFAARGALRRHPELPLKTPFRAGAAPDASAGLIHCEILSWNDGGMNDTGSHNSGPIDAEILAGRLNHLCGVRGIRVLLLDGPQAWKSASNGLEHARVSERQLNTAAKTGLPGLVKPLTYRPYAEFCLDVYDALCRRGWRRLETRDQPGALPAEPNPDRNPGTNQGRNPNRNQGRNQGQPPAEQPIQLQERILVESSPYAAWKSLGLKPLTAKRRARVSDLAEAYGALRAVIPFTVNRPPNHDQLQAIVAGLAGLALAENNMAGARIVGKPPRREEGHWREGFIVLPVPPNQSLNLHWLH